VAIRLPLVSDDLRRILDHSWPFLFLDAIVELEPGEAATGIKNVTIAEPWFAGHFPKASVLPGVLQVEAMAQVAGIAGLSGDEERFQERLRRPPFPFPSEDDAEAVVLAGIKKVRFRAAVVPGDRLVINARRAGKLGPVYDFNVQAKAGNQVVADGVVTLAKASLDDVLDAAHRRQAK
jgi:3-hydroxyacyl-[acyl-carrier-protein] dehydratase